MRARATLLLLLAAAAARAGDAPAGTAGTPAGGGDSIATAKKDFADIKLTTAPIESSPVLPALDMKDLGPSPGAVHLQTPETPGADGQSLLDPSGRKAKEGTGNWLVDAMEKKTDNQQSSRGKDALRGDRDFTRDTDKLDLLGDKDAQFPADAREKAPRRGATEAAYNPLESFMGGWISARDHELLLPSAKGDLGKAQNATLPGIDFGTEEGAADGGLPSPDSAWGNSRPEANPYLAAIEIEPVSAIRPFTVPGLPGLSPEPAGGPQGMFSTGLEPAPIGINRSFIPEFAHPSDDDKYFKQLKRF